MKENKKIIQINKKDAIRVIKEKKLEGMFYLLEGEVFWLGKNKILVLNHIKYAHYYSYNYLNNRSNIITWKDASSIQNKCWRENYQIMLKEVNKNGKNRGKK